MPLTGDFQTLDRWERALGALASDKLRFRVADDMADATLGFVAEEFREERDPYGKPWRPKKRPDGRGILRGKTGRLIKFRKGSVSQRGYRVDAGANYFSYHQRGTKRMVARRMLPTGTRLPARWASEFRGIYVKACMSVIRGAGMKLGGRVGSRAA